MTNKIGRRFITPCSYNDQSFSGKMSTIGYKTSPEMCFLVFSGCQHNVIFKFNPNDPTASTEKLENIKAMISEFEVCLKAQTEKL